MTQSRPFRQLRSEEEGQSVLSVNVKRLKGDDEMKRIFGASVFAEEARGALLAALFFSLQYTIVQVVSSTMLLSGFKAQCHSPSTDLLLTFY